MNGSRTEIFEKTVPLDASWLAASPLPCCELSGVTGGALIFQVEM